MRKLLLVVSGLTLFASPASAVTLDLVTVADIGNACDAQSQGCFGAVAYSYGIGKYEVSNDQYVGFLHDHGPGHREQYDHA